MLIVKIRRPRDFYWLVILFYCFDYAKTKRVTDIIWDLLFLYFNIIIYVHISRLLSNYNLTFSIRIHQFALHFFISFTERFSTLLFHYCVVNSIFGSAFNLRIFPDDISECSVCLYSFRFWITSLIIFYKKKKTETQIKFAVRLLKFVSLGTILKPIIEQNLRHY